MGKRKSASSKGTGGGTGKKKGKELRIGTHSDFVPGGHPTPPGRRRVWVCSSEPDYVNASNKLPDPEFGPFGNMMFDHIMSQAEGLMPCKRTFRKSGQIIQLPNSTIGAYSPPTLYMDKTGTKLSPVPFQSGKKSKQPTEQSPTGVKKSSRKRSSRKRKSNRKSK